MNKETSYKTASICIVDQKRKRITVIIHETGEIILVPYEEIVITGERK